MKNLKIFFLATVAIVAGLFTACNDSDFEAGPGVDGAQVYFPESTPTTYSISDDVTSIAIPVKRIAKDAAMTVAILPAEESGLFTIPTSVSFAAGSDAAELLITFDRSALEDGKEYPIALLINDEDNTTPYGYRTLNLTVAPWPWEQMKGTGLFRDDWFTAMYNGGNIEIEVTVHKHKSKAGIYMIEEMYGWPFLTEFFEASQAAIEAQIGTYRSTNITIDCSDPAKVLIPRQFTGITDKDADYGDYEIATFNGGEGTLVNGVITFPKEGLALACKAGVLNANKSGLFRIVLPGFEVVDYTLAAAYGGMKVGPDNETTSVVVDFKYGADVTNIQYVIAEDELTEAQIATLTAAIADESAENINTFKKFEVGGKEVSAEVELSTPGTYTVVAVPLDKEKKPVVGEASAASFYFPGMAGSTPNDIAAALYKVSEYPDAAEFAAANPDYSSVLFEISGTEMKSVKTFLAPTSVIKNIEIESGGKTLKEFMAGRKELDAAAMEKLATTGKYWNIGIKLPSDTYFTLVVEATNAYGKTKLIQSEPFKTTVPPYTGELVIGEYDMFFKADAENTFENLFAVVPTVGSETEFFVKDFAIEDDTQWYATYDPAKSTLTMNGMQLGREPDENLFGYFTELLAADQSLGYGVYSYTNKDSEGGHDPIVLTVDPASKQISGLATYIVEVPVADFGADKIIGALGVYHADGTVITKHSGAKSSAPAAKVQGVRTRIPFSSVRVPTSFRKSLDNRHLAMNIKFVKSSTETIHGVRTLSVKTAQCEPLPKQIGRISIKENADRNLR